MWKLEASSGSGARGACSVIMQRREAWTLTGKANWILSGMMGVRRNRIRVYKPRLPFPTLQRKKTNIHGKRWCFPSGLLQMSLLGQIPSWIIKRTTDSSVPRKLPVIHCRHRVPLLLRKAQLEAISSAFTTLMSPPPQNGVPGRIPNERDAFSFTFSMKSSVHYLLKSQLDNFLIKQVRFSYTESSLHDYQHLLEHSSGDLTSQQCANSL